MILELRMDRPFISAVTSSVATLLVAGNTAATVWRVRGDPHNLYFALFSYSEMALLFICIRSIERLPPEGGGGGAVEKRRARLKLAVWGLATALCVTFCIRVSELMPTSLTAVAWVMALAFSASGLYLLFFGDQ